MCLTCCNSMSSVQAVVEFIRPQEQQQMSTVEPSQTRPSVHLTPSDKSQISKLLTYLDINNDRHMKWKHFRSQFQDFQFSWVRDQFDAVDPVAARNLEDQIMNISQLEAMFELILSATIASKRKEKHKDLRSYLHSLETDIQRKQAEEERTSQKLGLASPVEGVEQATTSRERNPEAMDTPLTSSARPSLMSNLCNCCFGTKNKEESHTDDAIERSKMD